MSKKARYLIIATCFVFFILASPLIVLYVRGIGFNFKTGEFYKTGILAVRVEPKSTNIFLDAKLVKKSEGNIKFLKPTEYFVALEKDGYQKWSKRLEVNTGKVTWANPENNKIFLFLESPQDSSINHETLNFYVQNDKIFYLTNSGLTVVTNNLYEK
ncbi:MAG: PEGA domain-containing protein, partial [Candidatus Doudnabacteria bacterium]|nr:PEGA domain-containing protein [Candidatus Doudnabacteria bacterium]